MITATARFNNIKDVEVEITFRMTLAECRAFLKNLENNTTWPNLDVKDAIEKVVTKKLDDIAFC